MKTKNGRTESDVSSRIYKKKFVNLGLKLGTPFFEDVQLFVLETPQIIVTSLSRSRGPPNEVQFSRTRYRF